MKIFRNSYLEKIVNYKKEEVNRKFVNLNLKQLENMSSKMEPSRDFEASLKRKNEVAIIAEFKRRSPSKGTINDLALPEVASKQFESGGADAISVLTDEKFFGGQLDYIKRIKNIVKLPILRKDFIIDERQIYESKLCGADAILLIAKILGGDKLTKFVDFCRKIDIHALVEVHDEGDIEASLESKASIWGINNRNLESFEVNLRNTENLIKRLPGDVTKVSESGIRSREDVLFLHGLGVDAVLVGELIMRSDNVEAKIRELKGYI